MAVTQVITKARGTGSRANSDGKREYDLSFQAITDNLADGPQTVGAALGFSPFNQYAFGNDSDPQARAKQIDIKRSTRNPYVWDVDVDFDTDVQDWDENPLSRPTVIDYDLQPYQRPATQTTDSTPQPVVNAAGIYFDPPVMVDDSRLIIVMERNEATFPLATAIDYQNAVNTDAWFGLTAGQGKILITGKYTKEAGQSFYAMRYEIHVRWETWTESVLNQGLTNKDGTPCTEKDGTTPVSEPVPLDASGKQLAWPIDTTQINYLDFNVLKQRPFAALNLP